MRQVLIKESIFADDAALTADSQEALQRLMNSFAHPCREFGFTISLKKTNILGQDVSSAHHVQIDDYTLELVEEFVYLGSTLSSNLSMHGTSQEDRQGSKSNGSLDQEGLGQCYADNENQDGRS